MCCKGNLIVEGSHTGYPVVVMPGAKGRAFKLLDPHVNDQMRELEICTHISRNPHPNIVKVLGIHDWGGLWAIEMERLEELPEHLRRIYRLSEFQTPMADCIDQYADMRGAQLDATETAEFKAFYDGVIAARGYLKSLGWVHYDCHSGNLMVNEDGVIKLIDFDIMEESD